MSEQEPFWKTVPLRELSHEQWEALCDGCAKCCLYKLEDEDTAEVYFTNVHCRLLDTETGRCSDYANRSRRVPDCVSITPQILDDPYWLPRTCAYRRLAEGKALPDWHPLLTGDPRSTARALQGVLGRTVCEDEADELESHIVDWVF